MHIHGEDDYMHQYEAQKKCSAQEWTSRKQTVLQESAYLQVILSRHEHEERVKATKDLLNLKLTSLRDKKVAIEGEIATDPRNYSLKKEMQE